MRRCALILATIAAAIPLALPAEEPEVRDIARGVYDARTDEGCATVFVEDPLRWLWDEGCDGNVDRRGAGVDAGDSSFSTDIDTMDLVRVGPDSFTGEISAAWGLISPEITFERRETKAPQQTAGGGH